MTSKYAWKSVVPVPIKPDVAGTIFEKIIAEKGELKPSYVVEEARPTNSPLHRWFEWNDKKAAIKWREQQAGDLIRCHVVLIHPDKTVAQDVPIEVNAKNSTRSFVSIRAPDGQKKYLHVNTVMASPDLRTQYIQHAYKEIQDWATRYESIKEFAAVRTEIKNMKPPE